MQELINKYVELSKQDPEAEPSWQCLSKSGVTKVRGINTYLILRVLYR